MNFVRIAATTIAVSAFVGCGNSSNGSSVAPAADAAPALEDYEINGLRGDAFTVSVQVQKTCLEAQIGIISAGDAADELADIHGKLPDDPAVKKAIREVATTLRGCGAIDQADRLNGLTD